MDTDDLEPYPAKAGLKNMAAKAGLKNLDEMSIEAIGAYIETLKAEITRAKTAIAAKEAARQSAHAVFKS